jgi:hypothetical protein
MNHITFGKDQYHLQNAIQDWCEEQFGPGRYIYQSYPKDWTGLPNWTVHVMFGRTTFAFKDDKHYNWFVLRWSRPCTAL